MGMALGPLLARLFQSFPTVHFGPLTFNYITMGACTPFAQSQSPDSVWTAACSLLQLLWELICHCHIQSSPCLDDATHLAFAYEHVPRGSRRSNFICCCPVWRFGSNHNFRNVLTQTPWRRSGCCTSSGS